MTLYNNHQTFLIREAIKKIEEWTNKKDAKPLLVSGARQVGKTFLIKEIFAPTFFPNNFIYINLMEEDDFVEQIKGVHNSRVILSVIEDYFKIKLTPNFLIIFDEIQILPSLRTAIKSFKENYLGIYKIISSGSYLGNKLMTDNEGFPVGQVEYLTINPLSFKEFLINTGKEWAVEVIENNLIKTFINNEKIIKNEVHSLLIENLKTFLLLGGLPEVIFNYIKNNDLSLCKQIRERIRESYISDISKYVYVDYYNKGKVTDIYNAISKYMDRQNNTFIVSLLEKNKTARYEKYATAFRLLKISNLIFKLDHLNTPNSLFGNLDESKFKIYFNDFGFINDFFQTTKRDFWKTTGKLSNVKGTLGENFVVSEISKNINIELYSAFYYFNSNNNYYEIDLLLEDQDSNTIPIEIKTTDKFSKQSLNKYMKLYKPKYAIVLSFKDFSINTYENKGQKITVYNIPLYAAGFLNIKDNRLNLIDIEE